MGLQKIKLIIILTSLITIPLHGNGNGESQTLDEKVNSFYKFSVDTITPSELNEKLEKVYLIDTRERREFEVSRIEGAQFISYKDFNIEDLSHIPKDGTLILYCTIGFRSEKIGEKLINNGYKRVYNLYGGIINWVNEGYEVYNEFGLTNSLHVYSDPWVKYLIKDDVEVIIK